jgi:hypothetical protein
MSYRKRVLIISGIIIFLASAFIISFNWGISKFGEDNSGDTNRTNKAGVDTGKVTSALKLEDTVSPNAKITIKIKYIKSESTVDKIAKTSDFAGKTKAELENNNYIVESITPSEVILTKKVDSYEPNKYVLGVKEEYFAIYRTDDEGTMYIEDESADITDIEVPTKGDYDLLVKGSKYFQFNSKEEVEEKLGEYSS